MEKKITSLMNVSRRNFLGSALFSTVFVISMKFGLFLDHGDENLRGWILKNDDKK